MTITDAKAALKKYFGYDAFRPMQADAINAVYAGRDVLLLMPTGGGKSVCFQVPAITMEGVCVVISPLISLMKDQVEALRANGVRAAFLNSSLGGPEQRHVEDEMFKGRLDLIYVSPEKMASRDFQPLLQSIKICLFAIDEAHCISAWGHDFRKEYRQLKYLKQNFPAVPVIALTATADRVTRNDIVAQLGFKDPAIFIDSFDRPNLNLEVRPGRKRWEQILEFIRERPHQSGIIYCLARKTTELLASKLQAEGIVADSYHAGMDANRRSSVQEDFINDQTPVVCATIAFGMGIDKSNVRWVIHYNLPKNIESFYQEIGRAGRDGLPSDTLLFYSYGDVMKMKDIIKSNGEGEFTRVHLAKLDRMQQYASSLICRRKILLTYFNETVLENCGNCDVCKNPPQYFDGTLIAQKALSAVARLKEQVATGMLVGVLRGSKSYGLLSAGYDKVKTYGAGRDLRQDEWFQYLEQLVNQGLLDVAYDDAYKVKLTAASRAILFDGHKVQLVKVETVKKRLAGEKAKADNKSRRVIGRQRVRDELFEHLRKIRLKLSREKGLPPYIVFSDATLEEMAAERPATEADLKRVSGVGEQKLREYGRIFLTGIQEFILQKKEEGLKIKGSTYLETYQMYKRGISAEEIAQTRELSLGTVFSHFAWLYEMGERIDIGKYVSKAELKAITSVLDTLEEPFKMKDIYDGLNEEISYEKIRLGVAYYNRKATRF